MKNKKGEMGRKSLFIHMIKEIGRKSNSFKGLTTLRIRVIPSKKNQSYKSTIRAYY